MPVVISFSKKRARKARVERPNLFAFGARSGGMARGCTASSSCAAMPSTSSCTASCENTSSSDGSAISARSSRRRIVGDDPPGAEDDDARAELLDGLELVRAVKDDPAIGGERPDDGAQDERRADVEAGHRLVENDQLRVVQESRREQHLLPHALRERRQRRVVVDVEAEEMQEAVDLLLQRGRRDASKPSAEAQILGPGEVGVDVRLLRHVADPRLVRRPGPPGYRRRRRGCARPSAASAR